MSKKGQIHATCIALKGQAVLLRGGSGCGKSDLALRLISAGAALVADDRVNLENRDGRLVAAAPKELAGKLEVRGVGIVSLPHEEEADVVMVVDLMPPERVERLPEREVVILLDHPIPLSRLNPFEVSAVDKLELALRIVTGDILTEP